MSRRNGTSPSVKAAAVTTQKSKAMTAIDCVLEGKSDEFKLVVYELAAQINWDDNDPAFLIAIATGQLEVLIKQYPAQITQAMEAASKQLEERWLRLQEQLQATALASVETASRVEQQIGQVETLLESGLTKVEQLMSSEREAMLVTFEGERRRVTKLLSDERKAIAQQAAESAKQQERALHTQAAASVAKNIAAAQEGANLQVKAVIKGVREKHYWEAVAYACLAALSLASIAWLGGWVTGRQVMANSTWSDIQRWNGDELKACQDVSRATCNFHIEVPKE